MPSRYTVETEPIAIIIPSTNKRCATIRFDMEQVIIRDETETIRRITVAKRGKGIQLGIDMAWKDPKATSVGYVNRELAREACHQRRISNMLTIENLAEE